MKNSEVINTFNVLSQLNDEKGLPIKFAYGLVKLLGQLKKVTEVLLAVQNKQLEGQAEYDIERTKLLIDSSDKDKAGSPIIVDNSRGSNYKITNMVKFNKQIEKLNKKYKKLLDAIKIRDTEVVDLLDAEVEDFEPYNINIKYLPVDKEGCSRVTPSQLTHLMPFLDGDIDDIPEPTMLEMSK